MNEHDRSSVRQRVSRALSGSSSPARGARVVAIAAVLALGGFLLVRAQAAPRPVIAPALNPASAEDAPIAALQTTKATGDQTTSATPVNHPGATPAASPEPAVESDPSDDSDVSEGAPLPVSPRARRVIDPADALLGPTEPLIPPVLHVDAEPAPRSPVTDAPLTPVIVHVNVEPAPRSPVTDAPLIPKVIFDRGDQPETH